MPNKKTFEGNLQGSETIATKLEDGDVALEDVIAKSQKGTVLPEELQKTLEFVEKALVEVVQVDGAGTEMDA